MPARQSRARLLLDVIARNRSPCGIWSPVPASDKGAQWIMAHPLAGEAPAELVVSDHSKILNYAIGCIQENGPPQACPGQDPFYRYGVTVTNWGSSGVHFNIQGGGNI